MILLKPSFKIETPIDGDNAVRMLKLIESAARTCYKSGCKISDDSYKTFVRKIVHVHKHESVIEHSSATVRFIVDRGISHELVRHRLAAFSQESTRYVDYSDDIKADGHCQFIIPLWCEDSSLTPGLCQYDNKRGGLNWLDGGTRTLSALSYTNSVWLKAMQDAEDSYKELRSLGWAPQQARAVLPNSTKTEVVTTANFREWRHIFKMRTSNHAHPQIREVMVPLLAEFKKHLPELFDDIKDS